MSSKQRFFTVSSILLMVALFLACSTDEKRFESDAVAVSQVRNSSAKLNSGGKLTAEEFNILKSLFVKYPTSPSVSNAYESVLTQRKDWAALAEFYESTELSTRTEVQKGNLAKVNLKLGRYKAALDGALEIGPGNNLEMLDVAAASHFYLGNYDKSKELLASSWDTIVKEKRVDSMTIQGLIHFYDGDHKKAREVLDQVIEIEPENISAQNALIRVYAAEGDTEKAKEAETRLQDTFDRLTKEESAKINTVERFHRLTEAYREKKYHEVIMLGNELLPAAHRQNKIAIYQYLYNSHIALGDPQKAASALREARKLQQ